VSSGVLAYKIPFFDHRGKRIPFARLRILEGTWNVGFGKDKKKGKEAVMPKNYKYNQRANTAPHLYFPNVIKWKTSKRTGKVRLKRLVITEGEKKAVKACLVGIPTVALAGVWNYKSSKKQISLLDDFQVFDLSNTDVEICYDSDLTSNEHVRAAINGLAGELARLKPKSICFVMLDGDSSDDAKVGLDDFLSGYDGDDAAREAFDALPRKSDVRMDTLALFDSTLCMVKEHTLYFNIPQNKYYRGRQQLFDEFDRLPKVPDPEDTRKTISGIKLWFDLRAESTDIRRVIYRPGAPRRFREDGETCDTLNTWQPSRVEPVNGEPVLWLELFNHLTSLLEEDHRRWFLQWLAYPIQNPGTKLFQSVFCYSNKQGVGKNFLVEPFLREIYGKNWSLINGNLMQTNYNSWAAEKQFVFMDEIYMPNRAERKSVMGDLKALVTNPTFEMNEKYQPRKTLENYANIYMTSNHAEALALDPDDRRFFVIHAPEERLNTKFYLELDKWARKGQGIGMVLNYLKNEVDCSDFNAKGDAPRTEGRGEVITFSADNVAHLTNVLINDPGVIFQIDGNLPDKELWTADELNGAMTKYAAQIGLPGMACSPQAIAGHLHHRMNESMRRRIKTRHLSAASTVTTISLYAMFNREEWAKRDSKDWLLHYKKHDARFKHQMKNVIELKPKKKEAK
jgi:hypothetical protein